MITLEKRNQINKVVENFLHIVKFNSGRINLQVKLELEMKRIFKKQSDLFWQLENKNKWLDKIYIQAQKDLSVNKMRMSENPKDIMDFIDKTVKEWHTKINEDKLFNKVLNNSYINSYNYSGQEALDKFNIKEKFQLERTIKKSLGDNVLDELEKRANLTSPMINATSFELLKNKLADSFYKEGKSTDKVARDIRGMFEETYKGRAKNIARTEVGEVVSQATYKSYEEMGIEEVEWLAEMTACELCSPLNGQVKKIGEEFNNGKGWTGVHPLVHPSCECIINSRTPKYFKPTRYWVGD